MSEDATSRMLHGQRTANIGEVESGEFRRLNSHSPSLVSFLDWMTIEKGYTGIIQLVTQSANFTSSLPRIPRRFASLDYRSPLSRHCPNPPLPLPSLYFTLDYSYFYGSLRDTSILSTMYFTSQNLNGIVKYTYMYSGRFGS